jgi:hypothetical protein
MKKKELIEVILGINSYLWGSVDWGNCPPIPMTETYEANSKALHKLWELLKENDMELKDLYGDPIPYDPVKCVRNDPEQKQVTFIEADINT